MRRRLNAKKLALASAPPAMAPVRRDPSRGQLWHLLGLVFGRMSRRRWANWKFSHLSSNYSPPLPQRVLGDVAHDGLLQIIASAMSVDVFMIHLRPGSRVHITGISALE